MNNAKELLKDMRIIARPITGGKTYELIKESARTGCYIVCPSAQNATDVHMVALRSGFKIPFPLTYSEYKDGRYSPNITGVLIDNAEQYLRYCSRVPIKAITVSSENLESVTTELIEVITNKNTPNYE